MLLVSSHVQCDDSRTLSEHFAALRGAADFTLAHQTDLEKLGMDITVVTRLSRLIDTFDAAQDDPLSTQHIGEITTLTKRIGTHLSGLLVVQLVSNDNQTARQTGAAVNTLNTELNYFLSYLPNCRKG